MFRQTPAPQQGPIAIYTGWGPDATRNPGDTICLTGAFNLLQHHMPEAKFVDIRDSKAPYTQKWEGIAIIGGGTVLPKAFDHEHVSGLLHAEKIYIFGSGCLSKDEFEKRMKVPFAEISQANIECIGLRGPGSVRNFKEHYGEGYELDWIGDLGFYHAQKQAKAKKTGTKNLAIFYIENTEDKWRIGSDHDSVNASIVRASRSPEFDTYNKRVVMTTRKTNLLPESAGKLVHVDDMDEYIQAITDADFIITERLHPAIIATCYGIPFVYLQTTNKSRDLQEMYNETLPNADIDCLFVDASNCTDLTKNIAAVLSRDDLPEKLIQISQKLNRSLHQATKQLVSKIKQHAEDKSKVRQTLPSQLGLFKQADYCHYDSKELISLGRDMLCVPKAL